MMYTTGFKVGINWRAKTIMGITLMIIIPTVLDLTVILAGTPPGSMHSNWLASLPHWKIKYLSLKSLSVKSTKHVEHVHVPYTQSSSMQIPDIKIKRKYISILPPYDSHFGRAQLNSELTTYVRRHHTQQNQTECRSII